MGDGVSSHKGARVLELLVTFYPQSARYLNTYFVYFCFVDVYVTTWACCGRPWPEAAAQHMHP